MSDHTHVQRAGALLRRRGVLLALGVMTAIWGARLSFRCALTAPDSSRGWRENCDVVLLREGLDQTPRLRDTLRWWTGYWIGCNEFWRPLSSYAFWVMVKTLGWEHHDRFDLVTALCHVAACVLLFLLVEAITGRPLLALLSLGFLNVGIPVGYVSYLVLAPGQGGVYHWIYIPDMWLAICMLPALLLAWRGHVWWAVLLAVLAPMLKETGFMAFPLVMGFYWWRWRRLHPAFAVMVALAGILATVKLTYVGPGMILGSNRMMWFRMFRFVAPQPVNALYSAQGPWALLGMGLAAAVLARRIAWVRYGAVVAGILAATLAFSWRSQGIALEMSPAIALTGVLEFQYLVGAALPVATWIVAAYAGLSGSDRALVMLLSVGFLPSGLPATFAPQTGTRSFYTAWMLSSAVKALCTWSLPALFAGSAVGAAGPVRREASAPPAPSTNEAEACTQ